MIESVIDKQEHESIHQVEHKSRMKSAQELFSTFLFVHFDKSIDKAIVLGLLLLRILRHYFRQAHVDWIRHERCHKVRYYQDSETSRIWCLYCVIMVLIEEWLQLFDVIGVALRLSLLHEVENLWDSVFELWLVLYVCCGVVRSEQEEPECHVSDHQRHETEVCISCQYFQVDFVVCHLHKLLPGFERKPGQRCCDV